MSILLISPPPRRHHTQVGLNVCDKSRRERARKGARASPWRGDRSLYPSAKRDLPGGKR